MMVRKKLEPVEAVDVTLKSAGGVNWSAMTQMITALTPFFLALITYFTVINGNKATQAADTAEATQQAMIHNDSAQSVVLDTIHKIVNSQRTRMEGQNEALRILLEKNGVKVPPGLISDVAVDSVPKTPPAQK